MYCSGCGQEISPAQGFCSKCGRPVVPPVPPIPGLEFELRNYAGKVKALAAVWFIYAGLSLLWGLAAMSFANAFFYGRFGPLHGPWGHEPWTGGSVPPEWLGPAILHFVWIFLLVRTCLAAAAGWGLLKHAQWGRIMAIALAFLSLLKFPFGTALGIWTLVMLLGYRNATLYNQIR